MGIEVNPAPETTPSDQETLRRVYQAQMDTYRGEYGAAIDRSDAAQKAYDAAEEEYEYASRAVTKLEGKMDALRELAARDGIQLD